MKRLHVHVGVNDLDQSIHFYSTLFAAEPTVIKDDYAKWMLDDPRVNFAISAGQHPSKGIQHLGVQVESTDELDDARAVLTPAPRVIDVAPADLALPPALPRAPETMYARSGDVNIAYQVVGDAPLDLVFVMGWVSHMEYFWREPRFAIRAAVT